MGQVDFLIYDVGSTYTKVSAFKRNPAGLQFIGRSQAPTTLQDIQEGLSKAKSNLAADLGWAELTAAKTLATSSAAGGLRMVAMGYMPRVTAKAAKEVAMSAGARVLEIISHDNPPEFRVQILQEISPDIVLLAGGTDGGDQDSLLENSRVLVESGIKPMVIIAGNVETQPQVQDILDKGGIPGIRVANVMPTIHELKVKPARAAIHQEFIKQITRAKGLGKLLQTVSNQRVIPTPGAVLMGSELLALGTPEKKGLGDLLVIDLGGATTDIYSVLPHLADLSNEEKGLIVSNEKQVCYRTVEGNLGLRVSAAGILETAGAGVVLARVGMKGEQAARQLEKYTCDLEQDPKRLSADPLEKLFDKALAITAVEIALKRHAGYIAQVFDPVMGIVPGAPVGRDLRKVEKVIAVGGIFANSSEELSKEILSRAFADHGISLLPEKPEFIIDKNYLLYALGALSSEHPNEALDLATMMFGKLC